MTTPRAHTIRRPIGGNVEIAVDTPKPNAEREQTNDSLRDEREKSDLAIAEGRDQVTVTADAVLRHARSEADAVLLEARDKADLLLEQSDGPIGAAVVVDKERKIEDAALREERESADETLELERVETARLLLRLLPAERDETDRHLQVERVLADGALANRDDFLGMVTHDLRDLLSGIVMSAAVITKTVAGTAHAAPVGVETMRIQRHTARASRLICDLVDVESIDAGRLSMTVAPGDLQALLAQAAEEFRATAAVKGIDVTVDNAGRALPARFDHGRLLQVLENLIRNAIKFSPRGSRIVLRAERAGDELHCSVTDQGVGIPADQVETVFERFAQVQKNDRRGLGLGLFIAKQIVEAHAGRIWVKSTLGSGTSVVFTIPIHAV